MGMTVLIQLFVVVCLVYKMPLRTTRRVPLDCPTKLGFPSTCLTPLQQLLYENEVSSVGPSISAMSAAHFVHVATTD